MKYKISVAGIVSRDNELLMVKEENSGSLHWDIPAGGVELGESPEEALIREVFEETGMEIANIVFRKSYYYIESKRVTLNILFTAVVKTGGAPQPQSQDIEEVTFMPKAKLMELVDKKECENKLAEKRLSDYLNNFSSGVNFEVIRES